MGNVKPERRMLVLPPEATKEGKNPNKLRLRPKRVPLRQEPFDLLESLRRKQGGKVVQAVGKIFCYTGRFKDSEKMYHGMDIEHSTRGSAGHVQSNWLKYLGSRCGTYVIRGRQTHRDLGWTQRFVPHCGAFY